MFPNPPKGQWVINMNNIQYLSPLCSGMSSVFIIKGWITQELKSCPVTWKGVTNVPAQMCRSFPLSWLPGMKPQLTRFMQLSEIHLKKTRCECCPPLVQMLKVRSSRLLQEPWVLFTLIIISLQLLYKKSSLKSKWFNIISLFSFL